MIATARVMVQYYNFVGRFLGKAVLDRQVVDIRLERTALLHLLGRSVTLDDLIELDPHRCKGLKWILEQETIGEVGDDFTFSVDIEVFGEMVTVDLRPGGRDVTVTDDNRQEYVDAMVNFVAYTRVEAQIKAMVEGFHDLVPVASLADFEVEELLKLLMGQDSVDVTEIEAVAKYTGGYTDESAQVGWFWQVLKEFEPGQQRATLRFITGLHKVPLDGFTPPFTIMRSTHEAGKGSLPRSHTCFNQLALPPYESADEVKEKLLYAIANVPDAFHMS
mmetsp:Transcript_92560/g.264471  ORF Transcript_92560/g.264471 Transcript_92560/m.264471 type:complete len:276 (-) Transcript_92560:181-1008(-)